MEFVGWKKADEVKIVVKKVERWFQWSEVEFVVPVVSVGELTFCRCVYCWRVYSCDDSRNTGNKGFVYRNDNVR